MQMQCILTGHSLPTRQLHQARQGRESSGHRRKLLPARIERLKCYLLHQTKYKVFLLVAAEAEAHQRGAQCAHASWQPGHPQTGIATWLACLEHRALQPGKPHKVVPYTTFRIGSCMASREIDAREARQGGNARQHLQSLKVAPLKVQAHQIG